MADDHTVAQVDEQAIFHNTRDLVQSHRQMTRLADTLQVQIKDVIALIRQHRAIFTHPQGDIAGEGVLANQHLFDQNLRRGPSKADDFDRQRKGPQIGHLFRGIGDHDHLIAGSGHDLFLQQGCPTAFYQVEILVKLIRAINGQV